MPQLSDVTPLVAVVTALAAAAEAPIAAPTRRSRRAGRTAEQQIVTQTLAATPVVAHAPASTPVADQAPLLDTVQVATEPFELLEPVIDDATQPIAKTPGEDAADTTFYSPESASAPTAAEMDAFEAAARLFAFTGETPIQSSQTDAADEEPAAAAAEPEEKHVPSRRNGGASFKRLTATSFSVGVMGIVGLLTVGMTMPADAVSAPSGTDITTSLVASAAGDVQVDEDEIQAYITPTGVENVAIDRAETYSTLTMAQLASDSGISNFSNFFVNNPNSPIQWPFAVGVPISYGFGMRDGTMHEGADFTPGEGAPIQAIADGVVRESTDSGGAFGVHIVIDHVIDGELISSSYSHMLYGSRTVEVGDHVTVGTIVGNTGNTGRSFGAHTHFEMLANGTTPIDPIPWLREHAGG